MNALQVLASPTCEARTGHRKTDWGFQTLWCRQTIGLRSFTDKAGETRRYCAAQGHMEATVAYFGLAPVEPVDGIDAAKAREFVTYDGGRFGDIEVEVV